MGLLGHGRGGRKCVLACAVFASLNSILLGYDMGAMSGAILFIQRDLKITEVQQEVLVGCLSVVSIVGSLLGGRASDAIGRKWTIGLAAVVFQTGAAVMALAPSFTALMAGRVMTGVGIGFGVMVAPVYIAEIAPAVARGSFTSFPEVFINLGILLGYVANYAFAGLPEHVGWRVMLGAGIVPSVFIDLALCVIPESPRWLVMQKRTEEARTVLLKINAGDEAEAEQRLAEIKEADAAARHEETAAWREFLRPSQPLRRMLVAGWGVMFFQEITGTDAVVYYTPTILRDAGIVSDTKLLAATVAVGFTKTVFILVAIVLIDRAGRKPLLYASTGGMTACLLLLGIALTLQHVSPDAGVRLAVLAVCGIVAFFSVGIGPICWVLTSEIFPLRLRAQASAVGSVWNRVASGLVSMSFLSVSRRISVAGTFFVFAAISLISVAFVHRFVPETKGKSLEQIEKLFHNESDEQESHGEPLIQGR